MVNRLWRLHVWRLSGPPDSWQKQLERHLAEQPVLAVISGIGGTTWAPVQAFCEHESVPCLFPNVEAPPGDANGNFYSLYVSHGVLLEAGLMANRIVDSGVAGKAVKVVRQVYRAGDVGEVAAGALAEALERRGLRVRSQVIRPDASSQSVAATVRKAETADVLVLWLRPADLTALGRAPTKPAAVLMSGLMGGLEASPLPESWRERTEVAYPVDLPDRRRVRVDYARGWFAIRRIPVVDERVQADTYLACGLLAETLSHMADTFVRDYLVERVEDLLEHRILTGYYPRLALATGQRFASKGGYIVHFPDPQGSRLATDTNWIAP